MNLFQSGDFTLASGQPSTFKIECDALVPADWVSIAELIAKEYSFSEVHGVPRGGNILAALLHPHCKPPHINSLIVDDVYTTGGSIRAYRDTLIARPNGGGRRYLGVVLFARGRINDADRWVSPIFQYWR